MSGDVNPTDIDAATVLLLHFDGSNYSQNFVDSSPRNHPITASAGAFHNTYYSRFGGASLRLWGADWLRLDGSSDFAFGTGDFTIECWMRSLPLPAGQAAFVYDGRNVASDLVPVFYIADGGSGYHLQVFNQAAGNFIVGTTTLTGNQWYYVALSRVAGVTRLFLNGVLEGSASDAANYIAPASRPLIGSAYNLLNGWNGYIDELRVSKGVGRYTSNFTPPVAPFGQSDIGGNDSLTKLLLHCDGSLADSSASNHPVVLTGTAALSSARSAFGSGSIAFPGDSSSSIQLDGSDDFAFGTGPFCIDFWFYANALPTTGNVVPLYDGRAGVNGAYPAVHLYNGSGTCVLAYLVNGAWAITGATAITPNAWHHVALARSGGFTTQLFLDGALQGTGIADNTNYLTNPNRPMLGLLLNGNLDEIRVTKGNQRFVLPFTPPGAPYGSSPAVNSFHLSNPFSSWPVPLDWTPKNTIECLGGGGKGAAGNASQGCGGGGGGGAYARSYGVALTRGSSIATTIGPGGSSSATNGGDTSAGGLVVAKGGLDANFSVGGQGGQASASVGQTTYSGGNGGGTGGGSSGCGGGGAAGANGAGAAGGGASAGHYAGGGGGGANGGSAGAVATTETGGAGGNNRFGAGAG